MVPDVDGSLQSDFAPPGARVLVTLGVISSPGQSLRTYKEVESKHDNPN